MTGALGEVESDTENSSSSMPSCTDGQFYTLYPWALKEFHPTHINCSNVQKQGQDLFTAQVQGKKGLEGLWCILHPLHTPLHLHLCIYL